LTFAAIIAFVFLLSSLLLFVVESMLHEAGLSRLVTMELFTPEFAKVSIGTFFGCWGGVVSLLLRLPDFEILKGKSRTFLKVSGGTQPLIGGLFAFVLGAVISAKIINISVGGSSDL